MNIILKMLLNNVFKTAVFIPNNEIEKITCGAIKYALEKKIKGKDLTPFLLKEIVKMTGGRSLKTNKALAINNVKLGIQISKELA